jgi:hypothetical protein
LLLTAKGGAGGARSAAERQLILRPTSHGFSSASRD